MACDSFSLQICLKSLEVSYDDLIALHSNLSLTVEQLGRKHLKSKYFHMELASRTFQNHRIFNTFVRNCSGYC